MPPLPEVSDVPLTEDVVKKPPREFSSTFSEWAADNVEQVIRNLTTTTAALSVFFTVPDNFTLFITTAFFSSDVTGGGAGSIACELRAGSTSSSRSVLLKHSHQKPSSDHVTSQLSFIMPIKVEAKQTVAINNNSTDAIIASGFTGFLLPKKISIR